MSTTKDRKSIRVGFSPIPSGEESFFIEALSYSQEIEEPRKRLYGASAAFCPRQNFLFAQTDWVGEEMSYDASSSLYMKIGDGIEAALAEGFYRSGRLLFNNLYLPPCEPSIGGKIDLVYIGDDDRITIAEVKSTGALPTKPKHGHVEQLMTYAGIGGYDVAKLVYVGRNVRDRNGIIIKVFDFDVTKESLMPHLEKICLSQLAIDEGWLPDIPLGFRKSTTCGYCFFKDYCWGDDEAPGPTPTFPLLSAEDMKLAHDTARVMAEDLYNSRKERYVASLRHLYRNVVLKELRPRIIEEIEKYERF